MSNYRRKFQFQVLTPAGGVCDCQAVSVIFPASDGLVGILGGHAPLLAMLGAGPVDVELADGTRQQYYLAGGFAQVRYDSLTVLAEECVARDTLTVDAAKAEVDAAKALPHGSEPDAQRRGERLAAARVKLRLAEKAKGFKAEHV